MKKLMIAATVLAAGVAFAECDIPDQKPSYCAEVYDVSMSLKTTVCKCKGKTTTIKNPCGIDNDKESICLAWREVASKKVQGMIGTCDCTCTEDTPDSTLIDPTEQLYWIAKDKILLADTLEVDHLYRIGKKNETVEFAAWFGGLRLAGTGKWSKRVTKVSGNVAGLWIGPVDCSDPDAAETCPNYTVCDLEVGVAETVAYGSFTIKYNAKASKKLAATGDLPISEKVLDYEAVDYYCE